MRGGPTLREQPKQRDYLRLTYDLKPRLSCTSTVIIAVFDITTSYSSGCLSFLKPDPDQNPSKANLEGRNTPFRSKL
jgi:hypothetical protein